MKKPALKVGVIAALVVAAFVFRSRDRSSEAPPETQTPETVQTPQASEEPDWSGASAAVTALFNAAGDGDDEAYLDLLSGKLRRSMEENRSELGPEAFRAELLRSAAGIKGLATRPTEGAPDGMVALEVEIVFADRNERQRMLLEPEGGGWVIASIEQARMIEPVVPYGTSVFGEPLGDTGERDPAQKPQSNTIE